MVAFSTLLLLDIYLRIFFHEGELQQYENSEGLVFHWYRVNNEEGSDTKFQYPHRSYKLSERCLGNYA